MFASYSRAVDRIVTEKYLANSFKQKTDASDDEQMAFVFELARHGARAGSADFEQYYTVEA